jgi:hypothetical protein
MHDPQGGATAFAVIGVLEQRRQDQHRVVVALLAGRVNSPVLTRICVMRGTQ